MLPEFQRTGIYTEITTAPRAFWRAGCAYYGHAEIRRFISFGQRKFPQRSTCHETIALASIAPV